MIALLKRINILISVTTALLIYLITSYAYGVVDIFGSKEGLMLNWELLRMGLAKYWQKDIVGNKYDQFLQGAEFKTKTERKGMWAKILKGGM